jgi:hypothetical protein
MKLPPTAPGDVFGRLTVVSIRDASAKKRRWVCMCECGAEKEVPDHTLRNGHSRSCGCLIRENIRRVGKLSLTHGEAGSRALGRTKEYSCWSAMYGRCVNPGNKDWPKYGGSGVTLHQSWFDFEAFLADMGRCPDPSFSLDRIDNLRGYEPGNVRWASMGVQRRNQRKGSLPIVAAVLMRQMRLRGARVADIAHAFGWPETPASNVCLGKSYRDAVEQIASGVFT